MLILVLFGFVRMFGKKRKIIVYDSTKYSHYPSKLYFKYYLLQIYCLFQYNTFGNVDGMRNIRLNRSDTN